MFDTNRRKFPRANYPCHLTLWIDNSHHDTILANTSNIGVGGLCVHLNQGVSLGTKVDIQLHFPHTTTPLRCKGVVVRSIQETDRFYNIGIQFEPLGDLKYAFIDGKVAEIIALEQKGKS